MSELGVGICDLTLSFGDQLRLDIPSLNLDPTRSTMILGPNGAGKSLLLRVMHGLSPVSYTHLTLPTILLV